MLDFEWVYSGDKWSIHDGRAFEECMLEDREVISEINSAIENIDDNLSAFSFYDLHLSDYEHQILSNIKLINTNFLTLHSINNLKENLNTFLSSVIDQNSNIGSNQELVTLIARVASNIIDASSSNDARISLIAYHHGLGEYFPTWHIDKTFEEEKGTDFTHITSQKVFIVTFKGSGTLYHEMNETVREKFNLLANSSTHSYGYDDNLEYIPGQGIDKLFNIETSKSTEFGQGAVHLAGFLKGTIHTTPPGLERLVLIVKPYDKQLIQ